MMKDFVLRLLRVPAEPHPPAGSPGSIRVFRAAPNYYYWILFRWLALQAGLAGMAIAFTLALYRASARMNPLALTLLEGVALVATAVYLVQLAVSFWIQRLDYEMRWYIVTDRSLRIREGIWSVRELTMTFANLQQINIERDPFQMILGIADLAVSSAGGGGSSAGSRGERGASSHMARFAGVSGASEIRDLILERVRKYKDAGLGDPDDHSETTAEEKHEKAALQAAREVLAEARLIQLQAISGRNP